MRGAFYTAIALLIGRSQTATEIDQTDVSKPYLNVVAIGGKGTKTSPKRYLRDGLAHSATNEERVKANVLSKDAMDLAAEGKDWLSLRLGTVDHSHTPQLKRKVDRLPAITQRRIEKKLTTAKQRVYDRQVKLDDPRYPEYLEMHQKFLDIPKMPPRMSLAEAVVMYNMVNWQSGSIPTGKKATNHLSHLAGRSPLRDVNKALDPTFVAKASEDQLRNAYFVKLQIMYAKVYDFCHSNDCTKKELVSPLEQKVEAKETKLLLPLFKN